MTVPDSQLGGVSASAKDSRRNISKEAKGEETQEEQVAREMTLDTSDMRYHLPCRADLAS